MLLRAIMLKALKPLGEAHQGIRLAVVADDVQLLGVGTRQYCRRTAPVVARRRIQAMDALHRCRCPAQSW